MFDHHWTVNSIRPLVLTTIACFGIERVMFGSNFPVDGIWADGARVWDAYRVITADLPNRSATVCFTTTPSDSTDLGSEET